MMNSKFSASKNAGKTEKKQQQKQQNSPRSPLKVKDFNISQTSCSSSLSSATSISSEAPKGCLRFFLSHHSSNVSKNVSNRKPKSFAANNTPKSAPNSKLLRGKLNNSSNLQNLEKPNSKNVNRLKKRTPPNPCLYPWKSAKKPNSRSDLSVDLGKNSANSDVKLSENGAIFTPVNKTGNGFELGSSYRYCNRAKMGEREMNSSDTSSPIPPVQASVSPEIQGGSTSVVRATPSTCYGAGHVLSGVSDKRKCRPRGILTIGDNDLFGSSNTKVFCREDGSVIGSVNKPRVSLVPSPAEALMQWNLSPCDERRGTDKDDDDHGGSGVKLDEYEVSRSIGCSSSPSSSLGFSSELCNKSSCTVTTSEATSVSHCSGRRSSEFRGLLGPSFDHMVLSPSSASPLCVTSSKVEVSPKPDKCRHDHERGTTPCSENSIGSVNVIQTPQSNSSSQSFELSNLSRDEISRLWFESELDSVAEVLRRVSLSPECEAPMGDSSRTSFEFDPLIKPDNSIDFAKFRKAMDIHQTSFGSPETLFCNLPDSEVRISWREGLASRIFELDEMDCCRCFSDEEDDANGCNDDLCQSSSCPDVVDDDFSADNACESTKLADVEDAMKQDDAKRPPCERTSPCPGLSNVSRSSDVIEDSSWKVCYENHLFQI